MPSPHHAPAVACQMAASVRNQFETLLGDQLITFLGQYSATAAGNAASFALSEDNRKLLRSTRRKVRACSTPLA